MEDFLAIMSNDRRTAEIDREILQLIFERVSHSECHVGAQLMISLAPGKIHPTQ